MTETETTAAPVASEAPAPEATEAPAAAPEAPAVEPQKSDTPDQRRASAKDRIMEKYSAVAKATNQPRVPGGTPDGGQFAKEQEAVAPSTEASPAEVPAPEVAPASGVTDAGATRAAPADARVDGSVRIPVTADHPLRSRGREFFDVPTDQAGDLRAVLNSHTRRAEVTEAQQQLADTNAQLAQYRADAEYWQAQAINGGVLSAEQQGKYQDILNTYGEEDANNYRNGLLANTDYAELENNRAAALQQYQVGEVQRQAHKFANDALNDALKGNPGTAVPPQYPHWSETEVRQALSGYGSICDARNTPPTPSGWYVYANAVYASHPNVVADRNSRTIQTAVDARAKAKKEAGVKEAAAMKDAATRHATLPGYIPSSVSTSGVNHGTPDEEAEMRKLAPSQQKRARSARIREWGQRAR